MATTLCVLLKAVCGTDDRTGRLFGVEVIAPVTVEDAVGVITVWLERYPFLLGDIVTIPGVEMLPVGLINLLESEL